MPEGPEVRTYRDQLREFVIGKEINSIDILSGRYLNKSPEGLLKFKSLLPIKITNVDCKGKFLYFSTENPDVTIWSTLGMTGSWGSDPTKHSRVKFTLNDGLLFFTDIRNFGTIHFSFDKKELTKKIAELGADILDKEINADYFLSLARTRTHMNITEFLMSQKYLSGVGNYIKCEALYKAKISPNLTISKIDDERLKNLIVIIQSIARDSYKEAGSTFRTYKNFDGGVGGYSFYFQVYGKEQDPLNNKVEVIETPDKRSTHWVPGVQY